jgi:hypothetical protein
MDCNNIKEMLMFRLFQRSRTCRRALLAAAPLVTVSMLCGSVSHAAGSLVVKSLEYPPSPSCLQQIPPVSRKVANQYVLLLFFNTSVSGEVDAVFHTQPSMSPTGQTQPRYDGCWTDPGVAAANVAAAPVVLRVQGGCPTDCVKPSAAGQTVKSKSNKSSAVLPRSSYPGDPLSNLDPTYMWGLFFADPAGGDNASNDDKTKFAVWQIFVQDSLQAGRVINDLYTNTASKALFSSSGYLGHIMIGFKPPPAPTP